MNRPPPSLPDTPRGDTLRPRRAVRSAPAGGQRLQPLQQAIQHPVVTPATRALGAMPIAVSSTRTLARLARAGVPTLLSQSRAASGKMIQQATADAALARALSSGSKGGGSKGGGEQPTIDELVAAAPEVIAANAALKTAQARAEAATRAAEAATFSAVAKAMRAKNLCGAGGRERALARAACDGARSAAEAAEAAIEAADKLTAEARTAEMTALRAAAAAHMAAIQPPTKTEEEEASGAGRGAGAPPPPALATSCSRTILGARAAVSSPVTRRSPC